MAMNLKTPPHPLISKSFRTPKGCHVRYVELHSDGARVGYDCGDGGRGEFPLPEGGGFGTYPSAHIKGTRVVHVPGSTVSGHGARVGFVLSPDYVTCRKTRTDPEMRCSVHKSDGAVLSGARKRARRRGKR